MELYSVRPRQAPGPAGWLAHPGVDVAQRGAIGRLARGFAGPAVVAAQIQQSRFSAHFLVHGGVEPARPGVAALPGWACVVALDVMEALLAAFIQKSERPTP